MGLAASQARFLGLTSRKSACEFKSTELAEEKLQLSNQLAQISDDYFNALNATKLTWQSELDENVYGLSYGLLMTPTALNDYNPYMVTSQSGAIVLNDEFMQAAKAAGINMSGGAPSQEDRDKFLQSLADSGLITQPTADIITKIDNAINPNRENDVNYIPWDSQSGVGGIVFDKNSVDAMNISDIMMSDSMGQKYINWTSSSYPQVILKEAYDVRCENLSSNVEKAALSFVYTENKDEGKYYLKSELDLLKSLIEYRTGQNTELNALANEWGVGKYELGQEINEIRKNAYPAIFSFSSEISEGQGNYTLLKDRSTIKSQADLNNLQIADLIGSDLVLVCATGTQEGITVEEKRQAEKTFIENVLSIMTPVFESFGLGDTEHKTGLNVDEASAYALEYAYKMIKNVYLRSSNIVIKDNETTSKDSAYKNAVENNRVGQGSDRKYTAVSLSNILSAFLTYYDESVMAQAGGASSFNVAKTVEASLYVTESSSYLYYGQSSDIQMTQEEKIADFYDELYNNICRHGWRYDDSISNDENLTAAIKDGRYALSALHDDGYFYQTNYLNIDYLVEVPDNDAIARAEAEYSRKKAEITYKEDAIDIKTKKLDAEIAAITTEINSVQSMIQEGTKVFNYFQN